MLKLEFVKKAIMEGKQIRIISFDDLLEILKVSEETLSQTPYPEAINFVKKKG